MIPRILHYVWVGPKPLSNQAEGLIEGWRKIMPDYEIMCWNNDTIDFSSKYLQAAFGVGAWNRVSDYQRMCALVKYGGIYLDTDIEVRKSFDPLLSNSCFLGFQRNDFPRELVNGAILGAEVGHWFIRELKDYFDNKLHGAMDIGAFSGPGLITNVLQEKGLRGYADEPLNIKDITIYPLRYFYPYHWEENFSERCITPDTFSIHLWEDTWGKQVLPKSQVWKKISKRLDYLLALFAPKLAFKRRMRRIRHTQLSGAL